MTLLRSLATLLLLVLATAGCRVQRQVYETGSGDGLILRLHTPVFEVTKAGTEVPVQLSVTNAGETSRTLSFSSSKRFDLRVEDAEGNVRWAHSDGRFYLMVMQERRLNPGETLEAEPIRVPFPPAFEDWEAGTYYLIPVLEEKAKIVGGPVPILYVP